MDRVRRSRTRSRSYPTFRQMAHRIGGARGSAGEVGVQWQEKDRAAIDSAIEAFYFAGWEQGAGAWDAGAKYKCRSCRQ